uniref:F-box domain-containing protein n=1 Tax=Steinernema glaseri TaxID=37863 RepID=A0A1I8AQY6_9BILA
MYHKAVVHHASLSKNDRIANIWMGHSHFKDTPNRLSLERFRSTVLPALKSVLLDVHGFNIQSPSRLYPRNAMDSFFSSLHGRVLKIDTGYVGEKCIEFIARQIRVGYLRELKLRGKDWPESIKVTLKSFLKSPNCGFVDLRKTNLTVDLDLLSCIVRSFLKGDLRESVRFYGKPADGKVKELRRALLSRDNLPLFHGFPKPTVFVNTESLRMLLWTGPDPRRLFAYFPTEFIHICQL